MVRTEPVLAHGRRAPAYCQPDPQLTACAGHRTEALARWVCPACGTTRCGFIEASDHWPRRCRNYRGSGTGERKRCDGIMQEVFRAAYSSREDVDEAA